MAITAVNALATSGISATLADARFAKPIDTDLLSHLVETHAALLIVEEGAPGGFLRRMCWPGWQMRAASTRGVAVRALTLPDRFIDHDSQSGQLALAGLDAASIEQAAFAACSIGQRPANTICTLRPA